MNRLVNTTKQDNILDSIIPKPIAQYIILYQSVYNIGRYFMSMSIWENTSGVCA